MGDRTMRTRSTLRRWLLTTVATTLVATGCGSAGTGGSPASTPARSTTGADGGSGALATGSMALASAASPSTAMASARTAATPAHLRLVAIGDSIAQPSDCAGCTDFVHLYGQAISAATGIPVDVDDRAAIQLSGLPPVEASALLDDLLVDASLRQAIAGADIVLVNVGFNDTPWNRFDNPCAASNLEVTVVQWDLITASCITRVADEYAQTLDRILTQIDELRGCFTPPDQPPDFCASIGRKDTLLRVVTVYDDWIGEPGTPAAALAPTEAADRAFVQAQCWMAAEHGGRCADVYHALNGRAGASDAAEYLADDHTHLGQPGHDLIAKLLEDLGYAPLG
jgi:lysophospholipase L1-like esterase